jgi:hypothetical protein
MNRAMRAWTAISYQFLSSSEGFGGRIGNGSFANVAFAPLFGSLGEGGGGGGGDGGGDHGDSGREGWGDDGGDNGGDSVTIGMIPMRTENQMKARKGIIMYPMEMNRTKWKLLWNRKSGTNNEQTRWNFMIADTLRRTIPNDSRRWERNHTKIDANVTGELIHKLESKEHGHDHRRKIPGHLKLP